MTRLANDDLICETPFLFIMDRRMTNRTAIAIGLILFSVACGIAAVAMNVEVNRQVVSSGMPESLAGLLAKILPMLGSFGGVVGAVIAFLGKSGGAISTLGGGQHQIVLTAILSALQVASGKSATSEGKATLNGGTLTWSFSFAPDVVQ